MLDVRGPRRGRPGGFTLIELLVVLLIIGILTVLFVLVVMPMLLKRGEARTNDLVEEIQTGIDRWRQGEGKHQGAFPRSGMNSLKDRFAGNKMLTRALLGNPRQYINVNAEHHVGYLNEDGTASPSGADDKRVLLDGWGTPIVYWEWASKTRAPAGADPTESVASARITEAEKKIAVGLDSYDIYSAGPDQKWGTDDDRLGTNVIGTGKNPFREDTPATGGQ